MATCSRKTRNNCNYSRNACWIVYTELVVSRVWTCHIQYNCSTFSCEFDLSHNSRWRTIPLHDEVWKAIQASCLQAYRTIRLQVEQRTTFCTQILHIVLYDNSINLSIIGSLHCIHTMINYRTLCMLTPQHLNFCGSFPTGKVGSVSHFPQDSCGRVPPISKELLFWIFPSTARYSSEKRRGNFNFSFKFKVVAI